MAVLEVNLLFTGRGGHDGLDHRRTYTRTYEVITDDPNDDEQVVGNAAGIPVRGTSFAPDPEAVVVSVDPTQSDDAPTIWHVQIEYDTDPDTYERDRPDNRVAFDSGDGSGNGGSIDKQRFTNPLNEPAQWTLSCRETTEPAVEGVPVTPGGALVFTAPAAWAALTAYNRDQIVQSNGNVYVANAAGTSGVLGLTGTGSAVQDGAMTWAFRCTLVQALSDPNFALLAHIVNSAGLPFDPPATVEVSKPVLSVTKNMGIATLEYIMRLKGAVNAFDWRGIPPRCARIKSVSHDGGKEQNGFFYVTTKWEIELDPDTFDLRLLDAGFGRLQTRTRDTGNPLDPTETVTTFFRFVDANGEPLDQPVPLDGRGSPLAPGAEPVYRRYVPRQTKFVDFNTYLPF